MSDLISRQEAIDAVDDCLSYVICNIHMRGVVKARVKDALERLPSAQTELLEDGTLCITVDDPVKVKRVLVQDNDNWAGLSYSDTQPDYDSDGYSSRLWQNAYARGYNDAKREIALSGEYERCYERGKSDATRKGRWIKSAEAGMCQCSNCGAKHSIEFLYNLALFGERIPSYCPACGADMRGEEDETVI